MPGPGRSQVGRTISSSPNGAASSISDLAAIGALENHCFNPSFEQVLRGVHTSAIEDLAIASTIKNMETPGWRMHTDTGSPNIIALQSNTAGNESDNGLDVQISNAGTGLNIRIEQSWSGSASFLDDRVKALVGRFVTLSGDVDMPFTPTASSIRLFVEDVAAVATNFSPYHSGGGGGFERLQTTSLQIGVMVGEIKFGVSFESATPDYFVDNMCLVVTDVALVNGVAYVFRKRERIIHYLDGFTADLAYTTPADNLVHQSDDGASMDTAWDINADRPCWADSVLVRHREFGAAASRTSVRPAGDTNQYAQRTAPQEGIYEVALGSDGQLEINSEDQPNSDLELFKRAWVGYV